MIKVLGIDPGNYSTGFSILIGKGNNFKVEHSGTIKSRKRPDNLKNIFNSLQEIIDNYAPDEIALEAAFYGKNPQSLIRLGEVRGIVLLISSINNLNLFEYTPQQVKNAITGYGWSKKEEVSLMVEKILGVKTQTHDEADAIAVAFCHLLSRGK